MVTTTGIVVVVVAVVLPLGAVLGALTGFLTAYFIQPRARHPWRDAATGSVTLFLLNILVNSTDNNTTSINGHTLGWRGLILDHRTAWAVTTVVLAVTGRQLLAARRTGVSKPHIGSRGSFGN